MFNLWGARAPLFFKEKTMTDIIISLFRANGSITLTLPHAVKTWKIRKSLVESKRELSWLIQDLFERKEITIEEARKHYFDKKKEIDQILSNQIEEIFNTILDTDTDRILVCKPADSLDPTLDELGWNMLMEMLDSNEKISTKKVSI